MARPKKVQEQPPADNAHVKAGAEQFSTETVKANAKSITVTFTGDPRGGKDPEVAEYGGKFFPKGKAVTVDDPMWITINANIAKNSHFKVE